MRVVADVSTPAAAFSCSLTFQASSDHSTSVNAKLLDGRLPEKPEKSN
jgi:hypothetical protein